MSQQHFKSIRTPPLQPFPLFGLSTMSAASPRSSFDAHTADESTISKSSRNSGEADTLLVSMSGSNSTHRQNENVGGRSLFSAVQHLKKQVVEQQEQHYNNEKSASSSSSGGGSRSASPLSSLNTKYSGQQSPPQSTPSMMTSSNEVSYKRNIDSLSRSGRGRSRNEHSRKNSSTGGSISSSSSSDSHNSDEHETSKRRIASPVTLDFCVDTPSSSSSSTSSTTPASAVAPTAPSTLNSNHSMHMPPAIPISVTRMHSFGATRHSSRNDVLMVSANSPISPISPINNTNSSSSSSSSSAQNLEAAIERLTPTSQRAAAAAAQYERDEHQSTSSSSSSSSPPTTTSSSSSSSSVAISATQQEEEDLAASIALARQLMYEESMQAAHWIQQETLAAHQQMAREAANNGVEGVQDEDLLYALELASQEAHAAEHQVPDDQDFDVEEMTYDDLMQLGSRIGDVAQQRWQLDAKSVVQNLPTKALTEQDIKNRSAAAKLNKKSSLALVVEDPTLCQICQMDFECDEHIKILPCKHDFHVGCIDMWLKDHKTCCICKKSVAPEDQESGSGSSSSSSSSSTTSGETKSD